MLLKQEFEQERDRNMKRREDIIKRLSKEMKKLKDSAYKQKTLKKETSEMRIKTEKEISEASKGITAGQAQLTVNLRSRYEENILRRQAVHQSDHLLQGISELLTTSKAD